MPPIYLFLVVSVLSFHSAFSQTGPVNDGPYLSYKGGYLYIESVVDGRLTRDSVARDSKPVIEVKVPASGMSFKVPIRHGYENEPTEFRNPAQLLVISDVEGEFDGLRRLLQANGVIDSALNWTFGKGHLAINGDFVDRGTDVTAVLWLLYKLEAEASRQEGYVHVILGNHELMNLSGDLRYQHPKYFQTAHLLGRDSMTLYAPDTELGRWLRSKNVMERIGNNLVVHGGVSQYVNEEPVSLKRLNKAIRPYYDQYDNDSLLIASRVAYYFAGATSPFWYRGYMVQPKASPAQVDSTLQRFNVRRIIVGHNIVDAIQPLYNGKVIAIDVNQHNGNHQALLIERNTLYRVDDKGGKVRIE